MDRRTDLKSLYILRENIRSLLAARKEEQKALAEWCGHDKSWMNKFLNEGRGIRVGDFDRIASFFGIETYQLFQPGISRLTERRSGADRRTQKERRIGHTGRLLSVLQAAQNKLPHLAAYGAAHDASAVSSAAARTILERALRDIDALSGAREQAPSPRRSVTGRSPGRGTPGRSDSGAA